MTPTLGPDEALLWEGRAIPSIRGAFLAAVFLGLYLVMYLVYANIVLAFFALFFFLASTLLTIVSVLSAKNARYYITSQRIVLEQEVISKKSGELPLQQISAVRVSHGILSSVRGVGTVYFDSHSRSPLAFHRVKNPDSIKQAAIDAKSRSPLSQAAQPAPTMTRPMAGQVFLVQCRQCGARYLQGTPTCLTCGAPL